MRYPTRFATWIAPTLLLCADVCVPRAVHGQEPAPTLAILQKQATDAQARAKSAHDAADELVKDFATPLAGSSESARSDAAGTRLAAIATANAALAIANEVSEVAKTLPKDPKPADLTELVSTVSSAQAAAERAAAAENWARGAHEGAQSAVGSDRAALVKQANKRIAAAQTHEKDAAEYDKKVGTPKDPHAQTAAALKRDAENYRNLAATFARRLIPSPQPADGGSFTIKGANAATAPQALGLTYHQRRRQMGFYVVDGEPKSNFKLTLVPKSLGNPPARITLTFTFSHGHSGTLTIPRNDSVRLLLDANGEYSLSDDDRKVVAHDFIKVMDELDGSFTSDNTIKSHDVTITIAHDDGFTIDTFSGWVTFQPELVNAR